MFNPKDTTTITVTAAKTYLLDILLCVCGIGLAVIIALVATRSGPGVTPDSTTYINMASNIFQGRGFVVDTSGAFDASLYSPVVFWPPGYSLLAALLMVTGLNSLLAAQWVCIISFGLVVCATYGLGSILGGRSVAILAGLATLAFVPVVQIMSFALSEAPFTLFSGLAVLCMVRFVQADEGHEWKWVLAGSFATALALLTRYVGIVWVAAGLFVIGAKYVLAGRISTQHWTRVGLLMTSFILISLIPIVPWSIRNLQLTNDLTGADRLTGYHASLSENTQYMIAALARDFIPALHLGLRSPVGIVVVLGLLLIVVGVAVLVIVNYRRGKKGLRTPAHVLPSKNMPLGAGFRLWLVPAMYAGAYMAALLVLSSVQQFPPYDWPRYLAVVYPLLIVCVIAASVVFVERLSASWPRLAQLALIVTPFLLWMVPQGAQTAGFITSASVGQEYTSPLWRNNQGIAYLWESASYNDIIYSDKPDAVSFWLNRPAKYLPYQDDKDRFMTLLSTSSSTVAVRQYVIVFKGENGSQDPYFRKRLNADDIATLSSSLPSMRKVADFTDSDIYLLEHVSALRQ